MSEFEPVDDPAVTFKITKPLTVIDAEITELRLREPTGRDMLRAGGNPVIYDVRKLYENEEPDLEFKVEILMKMIDILGGYPPGTAARLKPSDITSIGWLIARFFIPG